MEIQAPPSRNDPCPCGSGKRYKHCCGAVAVGNQVSGVRIATAADEDVREIMRAALAAQRSNELDRAQGLYQKALDRSPQNVDALHMLGVVHYSKRNYAHAERLIEAADDLSKNALPTIARNLNLVRQSAKLARGEITIRSLLGARETRRSMGFGLREDAVEERSTKLIAFYLPQFHRIPENDAWWGEGFTEWTNVRRARPNFQGHYQPHVPGETGYYDLNDERILVGQADLAKAYGISGFCFYYYWFSGRRLLEMPIDRLLTTGQPDFPYCLCWANENWSRNWDGDNREVLVEQRYLPDDPERFIRELLPHFRDRRYLRVHGRPLLMVYRVGRIPNPVATFDTWRDVCRRNGVEPPYIVIASTFGYNTLPHDVGADAVSDFPPHGVDFNVALARRLQAIRPGFKGHLVSYAQTIANFLGRPEPAGSHFPGIVPSWDNTARRQDDGLCILDANPDAFELWLRELIFRASLKPEVDERIVFINGWNEWAEGCHLEPDQRYGRAWLEACSNARWIPRDYQSVFGQRADPATPTGGFLPSKDLPMVDLGRPAAWTNPADAPDKEDCVATLFTGGEPSSESPLLWRETLPEVVIRDHERPLVAPPVEVFCLADVVLFGAGWISRSARVLFEPTVYPDHCREWYRNRRIYNDPSVDRSTLTERRYRAGWHVSHFNCGIYGHWLGEVVPKLLVIREFLRRWPRFMEMPIFMPSVFPSFVYEHTRDLLPHVPIVTYEPQSEFIRSERMYLPTWGLDYVYNPWIADQTDSIGQTAARGPANRIFISRRRQSIFRTLENLKELETIAGEEGLTVVYPEDHAFMDQIGWFHNAELIVGEYGGALHNAIFAPRGATVIALNWVNAYQSRIARLKGHRLGYIMPASGDAILFRPEAPLQHYTIDPAVFRARLRTVLRR